MEQLITRGAEVYKKYDGGTTGCEIVISFLRARCFLLRSLLIYPRECDGTEMIDKL